MTKTTIVWFRQDLRISDNPALFEAGQEGFILPIYIFDEKAAGEFKMGSASRWWLQQSLFKLKQSLEGKLQIHEGDSLKVLTELVKKYQVDAVYWNRCYEPWRIQQDTHIKAQLKKASIHCKSFNASLLWEPWEVLKKDQTAYKVFTPFYQNGCLNAVPPRKPLLKAQLSLIGDKQNIQTLKPEIWHHKLYAHWKVGETEAQKRFETFFENDLADYASKRDFPEQESTSCLSPYLHFGEISPHQIWHAISPKISPFLRQLVWREFSYYLLYHHPTLPKENFQKRFDQFPWENNLNFLKAWQKGETGYALVDAGMRELWETGTMHNRVRMLAGSFLVKNLLVHWHHGAAWFWDCLVDADLANNSASWQWVAGSGVDASPYFRIFNPLTQAQKFDAKQQYIRRWLPNFSQKPIVDLKASREKALRAYQSLS